MAGTNENLRSFLFHAHSLRDDKIHVSSILCVSNIHVGSDDDCGTGMKLFRWIRGVAVLCFQSRKHVSICMRIE